MIYTPKLNLKKPESTDYISPSAFNDNADILDDAMLASIYDPDGDGVVLEALKATKDGNGNNIISTYLPMAAGVDHPIYNSLYFDNGGLVGQEIVFRNNSTRVAALSADADGGCMLKAYNQNGEGVAHLYEKANPIDETILMQLKILKENVGEIDIIPSPNNSANFRFKADGVLSVPGDVTRANPTIRENSVSNVSVATGNQKLVGITNIPKGRYLIDAYVQFSASATDKNAFINLYKNADSPSRPIIYSSHYVNRLSNYFHDSTWATFTNDVSDMSLFFEPNVTGTVTYGYLGIIRLS